MQCPSCDHKAPQADFGEPLRCPDCGAFYEKALALKVRQQLNAESKPAESSAPAAASAPMARGLVACTSCGKPISKNAPRGCPHCGNPAKKKTSALTWFVVLLLVMGVVGAMSNKSPAPAASAGGSNAAQPAPVIRTNPLQDAKANTVLDYTWGKSAGGSLMEANFTISNQGSVDVKDFEITCTHYGPSGTKVDSNTRTIFEVVKTGQTRVFNNFDMGFIHSQAVKTSCAIVDLKI